LGPSAPNSFISTQDRKARIDRFAADFNETLAQPFEGIMQGESLMGQSSADR
jgi:hypothetical protein